MPTEKEQVTKIFNEGGTPLDVIVRPNPGLSAETATEIQTYLNSKKTPSFG